MNIPNRPALLKEALEKMEEARSRYHAAKTKKAKTDAYDDLEFWSSKAAFYEQAIR